LFQLEIPSTTLHFSTILKTDGSEDGEASENFPTDECGENERFLPGDVSRRIFGSNPTGTESRKGSFSQIAKAERQLVAASGILRSLVLPGRIDAKGTEHVVRFRGRWVEKFLHSHGWMPDLDRAGMIAIKPALPSEYLRRLELQNELFGDHIHVVGLTPASRFSIIQPTVRGGEPTENEIRDVLEEAGWRRIPMSLQQLPDPLMGSAWWHDQEAAILLDARKPNFKKSGFGVLPIDLVISDLTLEMRQRLCNHLP
jgi:hypothetical protein